VVVLGAVWHLDFCGTYLWEVKQMGGGLYRYDVMSVPILLVAQGRGIRVEQTVDKSSPKSLIRCLIDPVLEHAKAINGGSGDWSKEEL
jgi:hypothetical protein